MLTTSLVLFWVSLLFSSRLLQIHFEKKLSGLEKERLARVEQGLSKEFFFIEPHQWKQKSRLALFIGLLVSIVYVSPVPLLAALLAVWFLPITFLSMVSNRRKQKLQQQLSHTLPTLSAALRAGHTFERSLETLVRSATPPISQEFELVLKELRFGVTLAEALDHLAERCPLRDLEVVVRAVQISLRAGSNMAEAFDRVAEIVRARASLRDRVRVLTAQGRVQAWISILMPLFFLFIIHWIAPDYLSPLFETGIGRLSLIVAAAALLIGGIWIHKISKMEFLQ